MRKYKLLVLTLMITVLCLSGCAVRARFSDGDMGIYEKIHRYYSAMESYAARVRLTVRSNKTERVYELEQFAKGTERTLARVQSPEELRGTETVTNGGAVQVRYESGKSLRLDTEAADEPDCSFVSNFFRLYYQSEETAVSVSAEEADGTTLLETELPPTSPRRSKASLLIDNRTLAPRCITVYDLGGNIVLTAEFEEFTYNAEIQDEIFEIAS